MIDVVLWVVQVVLALAFLAAGASKALAYGRARKGMAWVSAVPEWLVRTIGTLEILGAIGLILPALTGILPWLTPLAAAGLGTVIVLGTLFHATRREWRNVAGEHPARCARARGGLRSLCARSYLMSARRLAA